MAKKRLATTRLTRSVAAMAIATAACCLSAPLRAETRTYELPEEAARLLPGQDAGTAEANCMACHSADYINVQPRRQGRAFWAAEVNKMIKVFGAPMEPGDAAKIINYLAATY